METYWKICLEDVRLIPIVQNNTKMILSAHHLWEKLISVRNWKDILLEWRQIPNYNRFFLSAHCRPFLWIQSSLRLFINLQCLLKTVLSLNGFFKFWSCRLQHRGLTFQLQHSRMLSHQLLNPTRLFKCCCLNLFFLLSILISHCYVIKLL